MYTDREMTLDLLENAKAGAVQFTQAATETSNPNLRQTILPKPVSPHCAKRFYKCGTRVNNPSNKSDSMPCPKTIICPLHRRPARIFPQSPNSWNNQWPNRPQCKNIDRNR